MQQTQIDFLRHGEVDGAACFRGITDDPLTELGWRQMTRQCQSGGWQVVVSSPLQRCADFAARLADDSGIEFVSEAGWAEMDFGDWEGLTATEIAQQDADALNRFYSDPLSYTPPKAENYASFAARIETAWKQLLATYAGKNLLVVTHAGVIRSLYSQLLHIPVRHSFQIEVPHACLTRFSCFDDEHGRFVQLNFHKPL
jgi:alpha-ribazole phosphatase